MRNAPPPFSPATNENRQTLPSPTAAPAEARMNPRREPHCSGPRPLDRSDAITTQPTPAPALHSAEAGAPAGRRPLVPEVEVDLARHALAPENGGKTLRPHPEQAERDAIDVRGLVARGQHVREPLDSRA